MLALGVELLAGPGRARSGEVGRVGLNEFVLAD